MVVTRSLEEKRRVLQGHGPTADQLVNFARLDQSVIGDCECPNVGTLEFCATAIRRQPTGNHAHITVSRNGAILADHTLNIGREDSRTTLANAVADALNDRKGLAPLIKLRLGQFCRGVWETYTQADEAWWSEGAETGQPTFALDPYIVEGGGTILYGPPGSAKSWTGLMWAASLSQPAFSPWTVSEAGPVLFINLERSRESVDWRIDRVRRVIGAKFRLLTLNARGRTLADIYDGAKRTVEREGVTRVIVDSLSRAGSGNLNDNEPANRAMDALNSLAPTWVVIAHAPKGDASSIFGSVMFEAAADLCVRVTTVAGADPSLLGTKFDVTKANDVPKARSQTWGLEFDTQGLKDYRKAQAGEFPDLEPAASVADQTHDYLLGAGKASATEIASELGVDRVAVAMALSRDKRFTRLGREGRAVLYAVVSQAT